MRSYRPTEELTSTPRRRLRRAHRTARLQGLLNTSLKQFARDLAGTCGGLYQATPRDAMDWLESKGLES